MLRINTNPINRHFSVTFENVCSVTHEISSFNKETVQGIVSVLHYFRVITTCCSLSSSLIGGTSVLEFIQPFFLVTVQPAVTQSQRSISMLNLWVPPDFRLFGFFEDENQQGFFFLRFRLDVTRIWQGRAKASVRWNNRSRKVWKVCVQKSKNHAAICITRDNWR